MPIFIKDADQMNYFLIEQKANGDGFEVDLGSSRYTRRMGLTILLVVVSILVPLTLILWLIQAIDFSLILRFFGFLLILILPLVLDYRRVRQAQRLIVNSDGLTLQPGNVALAWDESAYPQSYRKVNFLGRENETGLVWKSQGQLQIVPAAGSLQSLDELKKALFEFYKSPRNASASELGAIELGGPEPEAFIMVAVLVVSFVLTLVFVAKNDLNIAYVLLSLLCLIPIYLY
ncbi:MAG: hypothetical protein EOP48_31130, partial [Sphingobacteriales bacterium]